jgi:uncharacterized protein (DUF58 family)
MTRWSTLREAFPVTLAGAGLVALCAAAFWYQGVASLDLVLLAGSVLLTVLVLLLGLATPVAALLVRKRPPTFAEPVDLEVGRWRPTGFRLRPPRGWLFLVARAAWEGLEAEVRLGAEGGEEVRPRRRALLDGVTRRLRVGDLMGLTECGWTESQAARVRILPPIVPLDPAAAFLGCVAGEDLPDPRGGPLGDRVDLRSYGPGDPLRLVLWKVYARTRKVFVRMPEKALEPSPRLCVYLPVDPQDGGAAALARTLLEEGRLGAGWRFGTDGSEDTQDLEKALDALARSGGWQGPSGLAPFLARAARDGFSTCLLLLPAREGGWVGAVEACLVSPPLRLHALFALDDWEDHPPSRWERFLWKGSPGARTDPAGLLALHRRLVPTGTASTLVDLHSGQTLADPGEFLRRRAGGPA